MWCGTGLWKKGKVERSLKCFHFRTVQSFKPQDVVNVVASVAGSQGQENGRVARNLFVVIVTIKSGGPK